MRFRFCGDLDCPDWVLAEINTLSRMTSLKMKLLCQLVMGSLLGQDMDYDRAKQLTVDAKFDDGETRGGVAALGLILRNAARYGAEVASLESELQQLGLPRELALAVSRCHAEKGPQLAKHLADTSLRLSRLSNVQWRSEVTSVVSAKDEGVTPLVRLSLSYQDFTSQNGNTNKEANCCLSLQQVNTLIAELKTAQSKMEELATQD